MKLRHLLLAVLPLLLSACAGLPKRSTTVNAAPIKAVAQTAAREVLKPQHSTKEQVRALLGESRVLAFDSGYEVWVYRDLEHKTISKGAASWLSRAIGRIDDSQGDLVLLFEPSGTLTKVRYGPSIDK